MSTLRRPAAFGQNGGMRAPQMGRGQNGFHSRGRGRGPPNAQMGGRGGGRGQSFQVPVRSLLLICAARSWSDVHAGMRASHRGI